MHTRFYGHMLICHTLYQSVGQMDFRPCLGSATSSEVTTNNLRVIWGFILGAAECPSGSCVKRHVSCWSVLEKSVQCLTSSFPALLTLTLICDFPEKGGETFLRGPHCKTFLVLKEITLTTMKITVLIYILNEVTGKPGDPDIKWRDFLSPGEYIKHYIIILVLPFFFFFFEKQIL